MPTEAIAPTRLRITSRNIDLWLANYDEVTDPRILARMFSILSATERMQQGRFLFADDRLRYLVTRAMVRTVLSRYAAMAPPGWRFSANEYGRPEIADAGPDAQGLNFNLSHTRGLIALAVSRDRAVGVDVENVATRAAPLGIASCYFAPTEMRQLERTSAAQRQDRFFEFWTFKESYAKARGIGLSLPLERFSFDLAREREVRLSIDVGLGDDPRRWWFRQCRPTPHHVLALCTERLHQTPPTLAVRRVVPCHSETWVATDWLRQSPHEVAVSI